jgi:hypothetical protein
MTQEEIQAFQELQLGANTASIGILKLLMKVIAMQVPPSKLHKLSTQFNKSRHDASATEDFSLTSQEAYDQVYDHVENVLNNVIEHRDTQAREGKLPEKLSSSELTYMVDALQGSQAAARHVLALMTAFTYRQMSPTQRKLLKESLQELASDSELTSDFPETAVETYKDFFESLQEVL